VPAAAARRPLPAGDVEPASVGLSAPGNGLHCYSLRLVLRYSSQYLTYIPGYVHNFIHRCDILFLGKKLIC
jgi:hypothetical protein